MGCHPQTGLSETRSNVVEKQFHPVSEKKCVSGLSREAECQPSGKCQV